uniref:Ig-like domain-containing protein n=1 Tax=Oryzias melastigma TaxID=30732 RepID=A0A3B3DZ93_ORYME
IRNSPVCCGRSNPAPLPLPSLWASDFNTYVTQPSSVFVRAGEPSVTLTCNQDNSQFYYMFWYRQRAGTSGMELLVYSVGAGTASVEAPFNSSKYSATRPTVLESSLQMQPVEAADAAVYFCASSRAQCVRTSVQLNNNLRGDDRRGDLKSI